MSLALQLAAVAPYYNLAFAAIALIMFIRLFLTPTRNKKFYIQPWRLIFFAFLVYLAEQTLTILRLSGIVSVPIHVNGFFELLIISVFIYALLLQKERISRL